MNKEEIRKLIAKLLASALKAISKLLRVKVLPKVVEKYCKKLQEISEKLTEKVNSVIDKLPTITDDKKRIGFIYALKLVKEATSTVGSALTALGQHIEESVDFNEINDPKTKDVSDAVEELNKLAMIDENASGDDGCQIV